MDSIVNTSDIKLSIREGVRRFKGNKRAKTNEKSINLLKKLVWIYFYLLIFEGALRKWILPGLAEPLLIVRDPVVILIIIISMRQGILPFNIFVKGAIILSVIGILTAVMFGHGNLLVALFGARIFLLYFVFIFAVGKIFSKEDVVKLGNTVLWIAIPMTVLIGLQYFSPQSSWVNRGVGGDVGGAGFWGSMGYFRPPGTFSFTNGVSLFYHFLSCFVFYFWLQPKSSNRILLIFATMSLVASIPLSISRGLYFSILISLFFAVTSSLRNPQYILRAIISGVGILLVFFTLSNVPFFQKATEAFTSRFNGASKVEGGLQGTLVDRYLGGMFNVFAKESKAPFFGVGIGMGSNVGSILLKGKRTFLVAESEWGRLVGEMGFLLGFFLILLRLGLSLQLTIQSYKKLARGNLLPWLLLGFGLLNIPQGQWAQPTALGFSTLGGGLIIASMNQKNNNNKIKRQIKTKTEKQEI